MSSRRMSLAGLAILGALAMSQAALAGDGMSKAKFGAVLELDAEYGGDDVVRLDFTNGDHQTIKAGQGVSVAVGAHWRPAEDSPWGLRGTVGYKYVTTAANNADIKITRPVLELVGTYRFAGSMWIGLGATQHLSPKFDGDSFVRNIDFGTSTGVTAELGWKWLALTYTNLTYSAKGYEDVDASSVGVRFAWEF